ncbi:MAG: hypothetical protein R6W86_11585 [Marinobacter sp.]|uniref:hypothetical protein n=1 Tax=Marinobacter sp. TaxID=50741 RepID=UPI00396D189C
MLDSCTVIAPERWVLTINLACLGTSLFLLLNHQSYADADSNGDLYVDVNEVEGNQIPAEFKGVDTLQHANFLYQLIYENESVEWGTELATVHGIPMLVTVVVYEPSTPNPNDTMVSVRSANGVPDAVSETSLQGKNHGTILDTEAQSQALHIGTSTLGWGAK